MNDALNTRQVRRLALVKAGLQKPSLTSLPARASGKGKRARTAALRHIEQLGYLQLDTISIAGARTHSLVLLSRFEGLSPELPETLLKPGEPLFEYWGHEASWMPLSLHPTFEFRREAFPKSQWWQRTMQGNEQLARDVIQRITHEGPLRSLDLDGEGGGDWWGGKPAKRVAAALWCSGELAISKREKFTRSFDLTERVIPGELRRKTVRLPEAVKQLLLLSLQGHGWASEGTLSDTFRLRRREHGTKQALLELAEEGRILACDFIDDGGKRRPGWILPEDHELAETLGRARFNTDEGVLLSPFDPVLWDRKRVLQLFGFEQVLEIYKPATIRKYGYYCLPVLAGERLVGRVDLKAERKAGRLRVLSRHFESEDRRPPRGDTEAVRTALERLAGSLELRLS